MNNQNLNLYLEVADLFDANKYFNDLQPWALKKTNIEKRN